VFVSDRFYLKNKNGKRWRYNWQMVRLGCRSIQKRPTSFLWEIKGEIKRTPKGKKKRRKQWGGKMWTLVRDYSQWSQVQPRSLLSVGVKNLHPLLEGERRGDPEGRKIIFVQVVESKRGRATSVGSQSLLNKENYQGESVTSSPYEGFRKSQKDQRSWSEKDEKGR